MKNTFPIKLDKTKLCEIYCWAAIPPENRFSAECTENLSVLSITEKERASRFHFSEDYFAYTTAHALLRRSLSKVDRSVMPKNWVFEADANGKPFVAESMNSSKLQFSLSHSRQLVTCVVSVDVPCGVDVEKVGRVEDPLSLAQATFSKIEIDDLTVCSESLRDEYFTGLWCLKEAYLKAKGIGLSVPLDSFYFRLNLLENDPQDFLLLPGDNPTTWQFELFRFHNAHIIAIAVLKT